MNQITIFILILFSLDRNYDMLENIDSFNDHLKRLRNIKYNEQQKKVLMFENNKVFMLKNRNEEECQTHS